MARGITPASETYSESSIQQWLQAQVYMTSYLIIARMQKILVRLAAAAATVSANQRSALV